MEGKPLNRTLDQVLCPSKNGFVGNNAGINQVFLIFFNPLLSTEKINPPLQIRKQIFIFVLGFAFLSTRPPTWAGVCTSYQTSIHISLMCRFITPQYICGHPGATYSYRCHWNPHPRNFERCPMGFGERHSGWSERLLGLCLACGKEKREEQMYCHVGHLILAARPHAVEVLLTGPPSAFACYAIDAFIAREESND